MGSTYVTFGKLEYFSVLFDLAKSGFETFNQNPFVIIIFGEVSMSRLLHLLNVWLYDATLVHYSQTKFRCLGLLIPCHI
jgi:hypothetical protein